MDTPNPTQVARPAESALFLTARFAARPAGRRELAQALLDWAATSRREPGLRASSIYEDVESPGIFGLVAAWESRDRLEAHLRSEPFSVLMGALEMLAEASQAEVTRADAEGMSALLRAAGSPPLGALHETTARTGRKGKP